MVLKDVCSARYESYMEYRRMHDVIKINGKGAGKDRCPLCLRKDNVVQTLCRERRINGGLLAKGLVASRK